MKDHSFQDKDMLAKDLLRMLEQGSPNDIKLKLSDGEMSANKDILMARSDYFATIISNNSFIEGETSSVDMSHCSKHQGEGRIFVASTHSYTQILNHHGLAFQATEEKKNKMVSSINLEEFTVKELMTSIRDSGIFPAKRIDERVMNLFDLRKKTSFSMERSGGSKF